MGALLCCPRRRPRTPKTPHDVPCTTCPQHPVADDTVFVVPRAPSPEPQPPPHPPSPPRPPPPDTLESLMANVLCSSCKSQSAFHDRTYNNMYLLPCARLSQPLDLLSAPLNFTPNPRCGMCLTAESWLRTQFLSHPSFNDPENAPQLRALLKAELDQQVASGSRAAPCKQVQQQIDTMLMSDHASVEHHETPTAPPFTPLALRDMLTAHRSPVPVNWPHVHAW